MVAHFKDFLNYWFDGVEGYICLPHIDRRHSIKGNYTHNNCFYNLDAPMGNVEKFTHKQDYCSYFSLNTFKIKNNRTEGNLSHLVGIFFDIDKGGLPHTRHLVGFLKHKIDILPCLSLLTSNFEDEEKNKYQVFYKFTSPIEATPENKQAVKAVSYALVNLFKTDDVFDLSRVARLPLTNNGKINKETEIVYFEKSNFVDFEKLLNWVKENLDFDGAVSHIEKLKKPSTPKPKAKKIEIDTSDLPKIEPEFLTELFEKYQLILADGDSKGKSRSEADYALVAYLVYQKKMNDKTIISILSNLSDRHDVLNDAERIIRKVRAFGIKKQK